MGCAAAATTRVHLRRSVMHRTLHLARPWLHPAAMKGSREKPAEVSSMVRRWRLASVAALLLLSNPAVSGAPPPPPPVPCVVDTDCEGCLRCRQGFCDPFVVSWGNCMCHDECVREGLVSC